MRTASIRFLAACLILATGGSAAQARVRVALGFNFGFPVYYRPYYGPGYYYPPYPVYVAPAPLVVQPVPVVQPVTVVQPAAVAAQPACQPATPAPVIARSQSPEPPGGMEYYLDQLRAQDERARADAAIQLGRMKSRRAVEPLTQALSSEKSPAVRDAAARALGLIGDANSLAALQRAAQADDDRDVRHSASFAAEIVRSNLRR